MPPLALKGNDVKTVNPFDTKIEVQKRMPHSVRDAAIELTDTLDLCWTAAQAVFEKKATPEHALALLPLFMERADAKRQQQLAEIRKETVPESEPEQVRVAPARRRGSGKAR